MAVFFVSFYCGCQLVFSMNIAVFANENAPRHAIEFDEPILFRI